MALETRKNRHRLSLDIPEVVYKRIRLEAINYNCTITKYVLKALVEKIKRESNERDSEVSKMQEII